MTKSATYFSIVEACEKDGCPLCRVEQDAALKFLDTLFYEQINEFEMRERLRKSLGLCHEHAWLAADGMTGNALGLAILYDDMLCVRLEQLNEKKGKLRLTPAGKCPACEQMDSVGHRALTVLARHVAEEEMREAISRSDGLCFHHMPLALENIKDSSVQEGTIVHSRRKDEKAARRTG